MIPNQNCFELDSYYFDVMTESELYLWEKSSFILTSFFSSWFNDLGQEKIRNVKLIV